MQFNNNILHNPTHKIIKQILNKTPAVFGASMYIIKSRVEPKKLRIVYQKGQYQTSNGAVLVFKKNLLYLIVSKRVKSLREVRKVEKIIKDSKQEILIHYPIYTENIKTVDMFNKMLGKAWKKN